MSGYYSEHYNEYIDSTMHTDMSHIYAIFEPLLKGKRILDVGFGSGRDMLYFKSKGYEVIGIDPEPAFVEHAKELGLNAVVGDVLSFESDIQFDGIWACASLLHLSKDGIAAAINHLKTLLNDEGVFFVSLKEGDSETIDEKGRVMTYVSKEFLKGLGLQILSTTNDPMGRDIHWINAAFMK